MSECFTISTVSRNLSPPLKGKFLSKAPLSKIQRSTFFQKNCPLIEFSSSMEDLWQDPLLLTDVSWQEQPKMERAEKHSCWQERGSESPGKAIHNVSWQEQHLGTETVGKTNETTNHVSWQMKSLEIEEMARTSDPDETNNSPSVLGFSLTSPDLVICAGSPDIPCSNLEETPDLITKSFRRKLISSVELSLENGIDGLDIVYNLAAQASNENGYMEASLELQTISNVVHETKIDEIMENSQPVLSINVGGVDRAVAYCGVDFQKDGFFTGGDVVRTEVKIGDGEGHELYQTARFGNFSYKIQTLEAGNYIIDLHLAEIIFTNGPMGMRVFDVFIQEEKVVSSIDIYAKVGSNHPLVLSDLKAFVNGEEGLSIRFQGVIGNPLACGISIRKDSSTGKKFQKQAAQSITLVQGREEERPQMRGQELMEEECNDCNCSSKREVWKLKRDYDLLYKEQTETKRTLDEFRRENELKSKECHEAWKSLQELQNELMRKSMHVGSLAYAVEGQVKEKSRWFFSLQELSKKFKSLKIQHLNLLEEGSKCRKCLEDVTQMTATIQSTMNRHVDLEREHNDLKLKFIEGAKERKELYNKVLELKGNIRVFCRCRPLNTEEIAAGASMAIDFEAAKDGELTVKANGAPKKVFKFDSVFCPQADQADVFEDTAPFATSVLDGYNVCIFAYGQTGSGKTFTMEGTEEARGVNYRTLKELFQIISERQGLFRYDISVSVLEVYNEQIRDLLVPSSQSGVAAKRLEIRQVAEGVHHVPGLIEAHVNNMNEVWEVLQTGSNARAVGSTNANEHSSRSHCIHCVMVKGENLVNGECTRSKLWLVDLAGSERIAKTDVQGDRLRETQNINKSLSALGDVISSLATKSPHIPFRNSKLTHLLQDSLGGDSKTLMFVQISPNENDASETLCSLNFASRVKGIELGPAKKQIDISELSKYKQMAEKAKQDIKSKDGYIRKMEETIYGLESKMKARDANTKTLQDKVKELESQLMVERKLARQHVDTKLAEIQQQMQQEQQYTVSMKPPPLAPTRPLGHPKHGTEPAPTLLKDLVNVIRPLTENNGNKPQLPPSIDNFLKNNSTQKENKPEMAEELLPKRTGRASICTIGHPIPIPIPVITAARRNSLIPFPTAMNIAQLPPLPDTATSSPPLPPPLIPIIKEDADGEEKDLAEMVPWASKGSKSARKINSILRRSVQKKVYIKSPGQHIRRGGVLGGMEQVRVSFGSRGRMAQRVLVSNASKATKEMQQKEKERGWNNRTAARSGI
ncbi:kinesin-like protein KIN-14Q [Tasmannia lanceolata]|uniref:kinesin-like protein KIN-14Q n=1 Tax=Tasmannia lanceolata TaxID=3420 RepID=UPI004064027E